MGIFRAYDIRGLYPGELDEETAGRVARAFAGYSRGGRLVCACDVRPSSPSMKKAVLEALVASGVKVLDIGTVPTPLLYFSIVHLDCAGGIMVTASHNPPEYNGLKVCGKEKGLVKKIGYDTGLAKIEKMVKKEEREGRKAGRKGMGRRGAVEGIDIVPSYERHVLERVRLAPAKRLRVAVDCGNGVAGTVAPRLLRKLGCEVTELYCNPDPAFPNHLPDPTKEETLNDLIRTVKEKRLDLGIALDADADRVVFIDEKGGIVRGDVALAVFAEKILERRPGAKFISEVKVSRGVFERIEALGGKPVMSRVGHAYLHEKMKETGAEVAGELSGHFYFRDNYVNDDGIYAAAKMAELLSRGARLSELAERVPKYFSTPEIRVHCADDRKFRVVEKAAKAFKKKYDVVAIDGARVELPDAWGLVRASNTEPALTLRFEGKTRRALERIRGIVAGELKKQGVSI